MRTFSNGLTLPFRDRAEAGRLLGRALKSLVDRPDTLVLALPRGGVPVAAEIARLLNAPLSVLVIRKLGVPGQRELAMGAITTGGKRLINYAVTNTLHIPQDDIEAITRQENEELSRRERLYCRGQKMPDLKDKILILVDDGIATGSTMMLAVQALREHQPGRLVVAVPVAPAEVISQLKTQADEVVCLAEPEPFVAVGAWYEDFTQISDHDVCAILDSLMSEREAAVAH